MQRQLLGVLMVIVGLLFLYKGLDSLNPSRELFESVVGILLLLIGGSTIFYHRRKSAGNNPQG